MASWTIARRKLSLLSLLKLPRLFVGPPPPPPPSGGLRTEARKRPANRILLESHKICERRCSRGVRQAKVPLRFVTPKLGRSIGTGRTGKLHTVGVTPRARPIASPFETMASLRCLPFAEPLSVWPAQTIDSRHGPTARPLGAASSPAPKPAPNFRLGIVSLANAKRFLNRPLL